MNIPDDPGPIYASPMDVEIYRLPGLWSLAACQLSSPASLEFAGYDYWFEFGVGGHTLAHGGSLLADSIRWLLR